MGLYKPPAIFVLTPAFYRSDEPEVVKRNLIDKIKQNFPKKGYVVFIALTFIIINSARKQEVQSLPLPPPPPPIPSTRNLFSKFSEKRSQYKVKIEEKFASREVGIAPHIQCRLKCEFLLHLSLYWILDLS